ASGRVTDPRKLRSTLPARAAAMRIGGNPAFRRAAPASTPAELWRRIGASRGTVSLLRHDRAVRAGEQSGAGPYPTFHRRRKLKAASEQARGRSPAAMYQHRANVDQATRVSALLGADCWRA